MKIGAVPIREDVERVKAVREAIGPDVKLLVDANCAYRSYEAIQIAKRIEEYDIFWFEEPVAPDDYEGHSRLADMTTIPIATGENEYTRYGFRDLIATRRGADPERRRQGARRRDRVHEGGGAGPGARPATSRRTARRTSTSTWSRRSPTG